MVHVTKQLLVVHGGVVVLQNVYLSTCHRASNGCSFEMLMGQPEVVFNITLLVLKLL